MSETATEIAEPDALQALSGSGDTAEAGGPPGARLQHPPTQGVSSLASRDDNSRPATRDGAQPGSFRPIGRGPFKGLARDGYDLISADPAWSFETYSEKGQGKSAQAHYRCMPLDQIKRLPVAQLAAPDCLLILWATAPMLLHALQVVDAWSFRYLTHGVWVKKTATGKTCFGTGYHLRNAHEIFIFGAIGSPKTANDVPSVIEGLRREHSRKPEEAFAAAEQLMPNARRIELFSRQKRPGWDNWGDQSNHFEGIAA